LRKIIIRNFVIIIIRIILIIIIIIIIIILIIILSLKEWFIMWLETINRASVIIRNKNIKWNITKIVNLGFRIEREINPLIIGGIYYLDLRFIKGRNWKLKSTLRDDRQFK
jgi:hypothetical protein